MESLAAFFSGLLFSTGLVISGMTRPAKVTAFLDVTGHWDSTLAYVMAGAVFVYAIGYRLVLLRSKPVISSAFDLPGSGPLDKRLILGSVLFGAGWGLAGYCPGPALVSLASLQIQPAIFVLSMLVGMWLAGRLTGTASESDSQACG